MSENRELYEAMIMKLIRAVKNITRNIQKKDQLNQNQAFLLQQLKNC